MVSYDARRGRAAGHAVEPAAGDGGKPGTGKNAGGRAAERAAVGDTEAPAAATGYYTGVRAGCWRSRGSWRREGCVGDTARQRTG